MALEPEHEDGKLDDAASPEAPATPDQVPIVRPSDFADPRPVEQQIYDSRDVTGGDEGAFGTGAFGAGAFGAGGFNTAPLNTQALTEMPVPIGQVARDLADRSRAPEPVRDVFGTHFPQTAENKRLMDFLAELDFSGGNIISKSLLARHGIQIEADPAEGFAIDAVQAVHQITALIAAFQEVTDHDTHRLHNKPPPALWVDEPAYVADVKALVDELRRLNGLLEKSLAEDKPAKVEKAAGVFAAAGKKFVESYADVMGKGAAALTIAGVATLCVSLGVDKGTVETIWNLLKPGK